MKTMTLSAYFNLPLPRRGTAYIYHQSRWHRITTIERATGDAFRAHVWDLEEGRHRTLEGGGTNTVKVES